MGKIGGSSWLNAVKKAFRSPTKDTQKSSSRRRSEDNEQEEEEKKRGKRRWIFCKPSHHETTIQHNEAKNLTTSNTAKTCVPTNPVPEAAEEEQRRAIAMAMATTAAAEAAVATAQAAVEVIRLTRPSILIRERYAAIAIQTSFRGYLARRALRALKGLVKLQALVRGHNVRKRAKMTLQCMQALVRAQARVRDQRKRLSIDSAFSDPNSLWGSHLSDRKKSLSRDSSNDAADEKTLAYAFSHQMWRSDKNLFRGNEELEEEKPRLLDQWMIGRASCDQREAIKTVEIDTYRPYSYTSPNSHKPQNQNYHYYYYQQQEEPCPHSVHSPLQRTHQNKTKPLQVNSASRRCLRAERDYPKAQTPTLRSVPNYMAATVSAKARIRSQSAPRQRAVTPEREKLGSAKKRLSFPVPGEAYTNGVGTSDSDVSFECNNLRSPSWKSIYREQFGMVQQQRPNMCFGDEASSPSTGGGVRRWLK
ncbi:hypothetical protein ACSBR1_008729 [Camellia fascicularis]